ncbi:MAG TPA: hypothetical protein VGK20_17900, partial [Candidatus Binatia bacterium]
MSAAGIPAGGTVENEELAAAPAWRREPYSVFFPLGIALSWLGVGRWLWFAWTGGGQDYLSTWIFHG